jgi:glycosyltransferase involved in cell wall biosynthesis
MNQAKPALSVIIVDKNDRGIANTLDKIKATDCNVPFEVIVVDSSKPEKLADIRNQNDWVIWDQFPYSERRTTPEQRNRGIQLARSDTIVFIDANCIPADGWLNAMADALQRESIVCGPVEDTSENNLVHYAPVLDKGRYIDVCTTINVGFHKSIVTDIGMFDESFSFGQDVDFFWRATEAGYKIYYDPAVSVGHDWGDGKEQLKRAFDYGKARAHLFKKHWHFRKRELLHESHVWIYPLFIVFLPITLVFPYYPLFILIPMLKNLKQNPLGLTVHHLVYGIGVIAGTLKPWSNTDSIDFH